MSTISAVVSIVLFALFSGTTYYYLDQEIKNNLTLTASELTTNYFVIVNQTIQYINDDSQLSITTLLKSRDLSAVIYDNQGNRIGTFGLFRYIFNEQQSETLTVLDSISLIQKSQLPSFSHLDLGENTYELYSIPLVRDNQVFGYLQLAKQYTFLKKLRSVTSLLFIFAVPPVILIVWFLSRFVLEKFLRPLETLVRLFSNLSVNSLPKKLKTKSSFNEMHSLVNACNTMIDRLGFGIEKQKHFIAYASHELNTPLTRAVGYLDRSLISNNLKNKNNSINLSIKELESVSEILQGLLLLLQPNGINNNIKRTPIKPVINKLKEKFEPELQRKNIKLKISCNKNVSLKISKTHLNMILENLISNAIKYTNKNGRIEVAVIKNNQFIEITITDTGIGISTEQKNKIFEPFFRTSKVNSIPGIGIGLSLVKQIANLYNFKISIDSKEKVGTKISIKSETP